MKRLLPLVLISMLLIQACAFRPHRLAHEKHVWPSVWVPISQRAVPFAPLGGGPTHLIIGTRSGDLELRSALRGNKLWRRSLGSAVTTRPALCGNLVVAGVSDGALYALSVDRGKVIWTFNGPAMFVGDISCESGRVFVGTHQGHFYALDAKTGESLWSLRQDPGDRMTVQAFAAVDRYGETYTLGFSNGTVMGVTPEGQTLWVSAIDAKVEQDFKDVLALTPLDQERVLVAQYEGQLQALRRRDGQVLWTLDQGGSLARSVVQGDALFIPMAGQKLGRLDRQGQVQWTWQAPSGPGWVGLSLYGEHVLASSGDGRCYVVDAQTGKHVWTYDLGSPLMGEAKVTDAGFWLLSQKGQLLQFTSR